MDEIATKISALQSEIIRKANGVSSSDLRAAIEHLESAKRRLQMFNAAPSRDPLPDSVWRPLPMR